MGRDAELEQIKAGVSCAVLLERHPPPWRLDAHESTRRCLKYRRGRGEILLVSHEGRGWWDPCSSARGDVLSLVQFLQPGLNLGQVRQVLRPLLGLSPSFPEHLRRSASNKPLLPVALRWTRRPLPARNSPAWHYLTRMRRLPPSVVLAAVRAGTVREGPRASGWFAHRDPAGRLTGIEMRGPQYRGFSPGGEKTLFRLPGARLPGSTRLRRVIVAEAAIDALSVAAVERLRADTLYTATAGGMGPGTITALEHLLAELAAVPGAVLLAASDADPAGERHAGRLSEIARAAGVRFQRLPPPPGHKDWNEVLLRAEGVRTGRT